MIGERNGRVIECASKGRAMETGSKKIETVSHVALEGAWSEHTTVLSCLDTSSRPTLSFEIATEISSLAGSLKAEEEEAAFANFAEFEDAGGCNGSPARMAFAYSSGSKSCAAKTAYDASMKVEITALYCCKDMVHTSHYGVRWAPCPLDRLLSATWTARRVAAQKAIEATNGCTAVSPRC